MIIKNLIRKWLGIEKDLETLKEDFLNLKREVAENVDGGIIFEATEAKEGSLKELVYSIMKCLKLHPRTEFYQETEIVNEITKRRFWVGKEESIK